MEKTNWIEKIKEAVRIAMNKGLRIKVYHTLFRDDNIDYYEITVFKDNLVIDFRVTPSKICLETPKGEGRFDVTLSKRDLLELDTIILSIEEYNEDMALSDFNNFFGKEDSKLTINDLDNEDD